MLESIHNNITELVGKTPLVKLNKLGVASVELVAKLESFNPMCSIKDRIGLAMIEAAEKDGRLQPGGTIVEPTSGNTGIALAFIGAARGYSVILIMPESMSVERRAIVRALGAELVLTDASKGMRGAIDRASEILSEIPGAFMPDQFANPANPETHYKITAEEIWADTGGRVDVLVCGVGTGGSITGVGRRLRELNPRLLVIAVEPVGSPVLSGGQPGKHKIQGIGAGFIPDNLDISVISEVITVSNEEAMAVAREAACKEGLLVGISSGAALAAACRVAERPAMVGHRIVVILPDSGERYLSGELFTAAVDNHLIVDK